MNKIKTVNFEELKLLLANFLGYEYKYDKFFNEKDLFKLIDLKIIKSESVFRIENWNLLESGSSDFSLFDLFFNHFKDINHSEEEVAIITMESYIKNKIFICSIFDLEDLVNNYSELIHEELDFLGPFDYIFVLFKNKIIFYVNNEGEGLKCYLER